MDNFESEEDLTELLEQISRGISDDVVESIINVQQKLNGGSRLYPSDNTTRRNQCGTQNVATMTELQQNSMPRVKNTVENDLTKKPTEKVSKKRTAEERKEMQVANKIYKPGECMKHMIVELHPSFLSAWYAADVQREVSGAGARVRAAPALCTPALALWSRAAAGTGLAVQDGLMQLACSREPCARALFIMTAEELAELVTARALAAQLGQAAALSGCRLTLLVFGTQEYFKPSGRKKTSNHRPQMTEVELEKALTDLLVTAGCDALKAESPNELALAIVHFTKAIAEAPHKLAKRQCDEHAQFYMRGDNKNCVAVTKTGVGAGKLWQQMLAVLPMSSLERARALVANYPSPRRLLKELQSPGGVERVADIGVARSAVPGCLARRTGVEFARKLAILFTADDGDALVQ